MEFYLSKTSVEFIKIGARLEQTKYKKARLRKNPYSGLFQAVCFSLLQYIHDLILVCVVAAFLQVLLYNLKREITQRNKTEKDKDSHKIIKRN